MGSEASSELVVEISASPFTASTGPLTAVGQPCGGAWCNCHFGFTVTDFAFPLLRLRLETLVYLLNKVIDPASVSQPVPTAARSQRRFNNEPYTCSSHSRAEKRYRIGGEPTGSLETGCLDPDLGSATY